jgi:hypothetical protein
MRHIYFWTLRIGIAWEFDTKLCQQPNMVSTSRESRRLFCIVSLCTTDLSAFTFPVSKQLLITGNLSLLLTLQVYTSEQLIELFIRE